jgi:hypothetical protein
MKKIILSICIILVNYSVEAQVGIGTNTPDNSAMLEVQSSDKGLLFPRMTTVQRNGISSPAAGLHVYDTNTKSLWFYNGSFWVNYAAQAKYGDVKSGIQSADHDGWVMLDGRLFSTLSASQQAVATSLGLSTNLPNASNAYLVQNGASMGAVSGANTTTLTQANLPNVSFTGTAANAGGHSHTTDPAAFNSSAAGSHNHTTDPAAVNTTNNGDHSHGGYTSTNGYHAHDLQMNSKDDGNFSNVSGQFPTGDANKYYGNWHNIQTEGNGNHSHNIYTDTQGNHGHSVDIPSTTSSTASDHTHSIDVPSTTSSTAADHTHAVSVSSGGTATPINIAPRSLSVNMFIYLGQ